MVEGMDASLGMLLKKVEDMGVAENTLVIFTSDNGGLSAHARGETPYGTGLNTHNRPLRAGKGSAYEGGTRVPFIAAWAKSKPDNELQQQLPIAAQALSAQPIISEDLFPTVLAIAGGTNNIPKSYSLDGSDISEYLLQKKANPERPLYFHYPHIWGPKGPGYEPHSALHVGDWKVIYFYIPKRWELYNIAQDVGERHDLAHEEQERLNTLATQLKEGLTELGAQWPVNDETGQEEPIQLPDEPDSACNR